MSSSRESVGCEARCAPAASGVVPRAPATAQPQCGIEPQPLGVVLIAPALGEQHQHGAQ